MPTGTNFPQIISSQDDVINLLDSEDNIDDFLNSLEKTISSHSDLCTFLQNNSLLVPIVFCYFTNSLLGKLDDDSLRHVLNTHKAFFSFLANSNVLKGNSPDDDKKGDNFASIETDIESEQEPEIVSTTEIVSNTEIASTTEIVLNTEIVLIWKETSPSIIKSLLSKPNLNFKKIGRIYLDFLIKINQGKLGIYLGHLHSKKSFDSELGFDIYTKLARVFLNDKNFLENYLQKSRDYVDIVNLCAANWLFSCLLLNNIIPKQESFLQRFNNYTELSKLRDCLFVSPSEEDNNNIKSIYEKLHSDKLFTLEFVENEAAFNKLRGHAQLCDVNFDELSNFLLELLQECKINKNHLTTICKKIEALLKNNDQTELYFKQMSKLSLAYQLLRLVVYSYRITQASSLCGPLTFLKILVDCYPEHTINMLIEFARHGKITIADIEIKANNACENTCIVQTFASALRHSANYFGYHPKSFFEPFLGATTNNQLVYWLDKFGFSYQNASYHVRPNGKPAAGFYHLLFYSSQQREFKGWQENFDYLVKQLEQQPRETNQKIMLSISSALTIKLTGYIGNPDSTLLGIAYDHWIELLDLQLNSEHKEVSVTLFTFARIFNATLPLDEFLKGYRGAIFIYPDTGPELISATAPTPNQTALRFLA